MRHFYFPKVLLLIAGFIANGQALSQQKMKTLKLITGDRYADYVDAKKPDGGKMTAKIRQIFQNLGYDISLEIAPWKRALEMTRSHSHFATFPWIPSKERKKDFIFSKPVFTYKLVTYVLKTSSLEAVTKESLKAKKLRTCNVIGSDLAEQIPPGFDVHFENVKIGQQCYDMLKNKRLDFGFVPEHLADTLAEEYRVVPDEMNIELSVHLIADKDFPGASQLMNDFNDCLEASDKKLPCRKENR